jgi:hypothetical protein
MVLNYNGQCIFFKYTILSFFFSMWVRVYLYLIMETWCIVVFLFFIMHWSIQFLFGSFFFSSSWFIPFHFNSEYASLAIHVAFDPYKIMILFASLAMTKNIIYSSFKMSVIQATCTFLQSHALKKKKKKKKI